MNELPGDRIKLKVLGLSYSQIQTGAYALILAQIDGPYRIPVVIGPAEAQSIALRMERITPPRPMTHDLFVSFAHAFGVKLKEVFIYKFEDGIFCSELTFTDGERDVAIDSRTSDAIAIAMRTNATIYTTREILDETGFILDEKVENEHEESIPDEMDDEELIDETAKSEDMSDSQLEELMAQMVEEENYEEAARISNILKARRENK